MGKLALLGGRPLREKAFPTFPPTGEEEKAELLNVINRKNGHSWSIRGETCQRLENEFSHYCGVKYAVAVNTGGMALQIALRSCGLVPGDAVLFQADTCWVEAYAVLNAGYIPIFVDADLKTGGMDFQSVESTLSDKRLNICLLYTSPSPRD